MIEKALGVDVTVTEAYKVGKNQENKIIIAKIENTKQKTLVMTNKNKLKGTKIIIENDLTKKELEIQRDIRLIAKEEREQGKQVKVGYQKLIINGQTWTYQQLPKREKPKN